MRLIDYSAPGSPDVLKLANGAIPTARAGEILIRVHTAGVNRPDLAQRAGKYPPPPDASPRLGLEVSGTVEAIGLGVEDWRVGDALCALTPGGGYAEYVTAPAGQCLPLPDGVSLQEAGGICETFFTVWANVFQRGGLRAGETLLVHGGTSGIGTTAIQLAKKVAGARVITTAGSPEKCAAARALGADFVIPYREKDFVAEVTAWTEGRGVDLILDMVGGDYFPRNLDCLALDGRLAQIAFMAGAETSLHLGKMMTRRLTLTGSTLRPLPAEKKAAIARELRAKVWPALSARSIHVPIDRVFPLADAAEAHRYLEAGEHVGKILLAVTEE